jgi:hypothetical protein
MSGQLHVSVALSPGKEILLLIDWEAGWAQELVKLRVICNHMTAVKIGVYEISLLQYFAICLPEFESWDKFIF